MKFRFKTIACLAFVLFFATALQADTVFLKNGQEVEGKIIGQTRTTVTLRTTAGQVRTIQKEQIRRIAYGPTQSDDEAAKEQERRDRLRRDQALSAENRRLMEEEWRRIDAERKKLEEERSRIDEEWARLERGRGDSGRRPAVAGTPTQRDKLIAALMRSAVLPGWGQHYQGRTSIGYIYGGAFLALGGLAIGTEAQYYNRREQYAAGANQFLFTSPVSLSFLGVPITDLIAFQVNGYLQAQSVSDARTKMESASRRANFARTMLVALYAWNLVDVVLYQPAAGQSLHLGAEGDRMTMRFSVRQDF